MSSYFPTSSSGSAISFGYSDKEALLARQFKFLLGRSDCTPNPTPSLTLDEMIDVEDTLVAFNEGFTLVDFEYYEDPDEENDEDDDEDDEEDDEDSEIEDEELTLEEELADLHELAAIEDLADAGESGFQDPVSYLASLEQASADLKEHNCLHRSPWSTILYPAPMGFNPRFGPTQFTSNLPAGLVVTFSHRSIIDPIRPAVPEYICPHAGCPIKSNHRTGKFSHADTDRPFRICFLELNLRNASLTFEEFMMVNTFYTAHEKPPGSQVQGNAEPRRVYQPPAMEYDSESDAQLEAEDQDEEDACAGAQEVKFEFPSREARIVETTTSIDRLIDARIEKLLADRAKQANEDRSKVLLDLLMGPSRKA